MVKYLWIFVSVRMYRYQLHGPPTVQETSQVKPHRHDCTKCWLACPKPPAPVCPLACTESDLARPPQLHICSYTQEPPQKKFPIFHRHFSNIRLRMYINMEVTSALPDKLSRCHTILTEPRLSSKTPFQFYAPPGYTAKQYAGDTVNVDYISIY